MPPCVGLRANIELARISGYIVREIYRIAPRCPKEAGPQENISEALRSLFDWHSRLPAELQLPAGQPQLDSACCTLHMSYNQLIILTTRPAYFAAIKRVVARRLLGGSSPLDVHSYETHTQLCIEAAQRNLLLAHLLQSTNINWLQSGLHFLFNATVILLLNRIYLAHEGANESDHAARGRQRAEIAFAISVFELEAKTGTNYAQVCCRVLKDLDALIDRYSVMQRPNLQLQSFAPLPQATPSQQMSSEGSDQITTVYESLMHWAQTDGLHLQDNLYI